MVIEKANKLSIESITKLISDAREEVLTDKDIVLKSRRSKYDNSRSSKYERYYYTLPGFARRFLT